MKFISHNLWVSGYVHTGPVPNGSDPILERTISVHTVPFRLSTSVHTGPVCYCSVLKRSYKSSCFYQFKHAQNTRCSFQNGAEVPKGTGPGVYTVTDPPKRTGPGVFTVTDPFGTGTVPKTGPAFLEVQFSDLIGNGLTVRLAGPVWTKGLSGTIFGTEPFGTGPVWT